MQPRSIIESHQQLYQCEPNVKTSDICAVGAFHIMHNLKCKVFDKKLIVQEANKK